jgi:hypothetical protein
VTYVINVDLESKNTSGGANDCPSKLHQTLGPHFDLTVHALDCRVRGARMVSRPPARYWDDNEGHGYNRSEVIARVRALVVQCRGAHARRCQSCDVEAHLPDWD